MYRIIAMFLYDTNDDVNTRNSYTNKMAMVFVKNILKHIYYDAK